MGRLIGIARVSFKRGPLVPADQAEVTTKTGIEGDARGSKTGRQVTVLFREGWEAACSELGRELPWIARRANLYVEGMPVPRAGAKLVIGDLVLEVTQETQPCHLMDEAHFGLRAALKPDWRGGVCCRVVEGGAIRIGDRVDPA
jgi:MOSC domain-containing protein YiiM